MEKNKKQIKDIISGPVVFDKRRGQGIYANGELIALVTTFPSILKEIKDYDEAEKFHTDLGNWIAEAINEKLALMNLQAMSSPIPAIKGFPIRKENDIEVILKDVQVEVGDYIVKGVDIPIITTALAGYSQIIKEERQKPGLTPKEFMQGSVVTNALDRIIDQMLPPKKLFEL